MPFVTGFAGRPRIPAECGYNIVNATVGSFFFFYDTYSATSVTVTCNGAARPAVLSSAYSAAYVMGGQDLSSNALTLIEKLRYYVNTKASLAATLTNSGRFGAFNGSNNNTAGYVFAGFSPGGARSDAEKLAYPTETKASISATLSNIRRYGGSMSNSGAALYMAGGIDAGYANSFSTVDKMTYSNDSRSTLGTGTSLALGDSTGFSNSGTAGYTGTGFVYSGGNGTGYRSIDKFAYSTDSRSTLAALTTGFPQVPGTYSNYQSAGYVVPNSSGAVSGDKFLFSNDTKTAIATVIGTTSTYTTTTSNSIGA